MSNKPVVLVVDDDATLRQLAKKQFRVAGFDAETADDGQQAVEMAKKKYSMIFMDLSMPKMNGVEATIAIRQMELNEGRERTPIVGMTAFAEGAQCLAAGMDDFVQKPMLLDQLREMTKKYLR